MSPENRLAALGIDLPDLPPPLPDAPYIPAVVTGDLVWVSGHSPGGAWPPGQVGTDYTVAEAKQAARAAGIGLLAAARSAVGSLDRIERVVRMLGHVNAAPGMDQAAKSSTAARSSCSRCLVPEAGAFARRWAWARCRATSRCPSRRCFSSSASARFPAGIRPETSRPCRLRMRRLICLRFMSN